MTSNEIRNATKNKAKSRVDDASSSYIPGTPSPRGQRALDLIDAWKKQTNYTSPGVPFDVQMQAWDIIDNPTEYQPLLSRKKRPLGVSVLVDRKAIFLK